MRDLIDAGIRTDVDDATVLEAQAAIEAVTAESLRSAQRETTSTLRHAGTGRPLPWANPAVGLRNAIAPPMEIVHGDDGRCWAEFTLAWPTRVRPDWCTAASAHWCSTTSSARPPATV